MIPFALAAAESDVSKPQSGLTWPFSEGPPGLSDSVFFIVIVILIFGLMLFDKKYPLLFSDAVVGVLLLGWTGVGFVVIGDPTTTNLSFLR